MKTYEMGLLYKEGIGIWDSLAFVEPSDISAIEDVTVEEPDDVETRVSAMHEGWLTDLFFTPSWSTVDRIANLYADDMPFASPKWPPFYPGVDPFNPDGTLSEEERTAAKVEFFRKAYTPAEHKDIQPTYKNGGMPYPRTPPLTGRILDDGTAEFPEWGLPPKGVVWPEAETTTDIVRGEIDVPVTPAQMPKKRSDSARRPSPVPRKRKGKKA